MAVIEKGTFENFSPSRFISFSFPNPNQSYAPNLLRIAVLDSPCLRSPIPKTAALLVPKYRQDDWIFSTHFGQYQLLFNSPDISRLILVGDVPACDSPNPIYNRPKQDDISHTEKFQDSLTPVLLALSPKSAFCNGTLPVIPFLSYEDGMSRSALVERCTGSFVGEMLVEDVEIEFPQDEEPGLLPAEREFRFRRRLRFKRMPNLVQTEIPIVPTDANAENLGLGEVEFRLETGFLVQPYLPPMVASLSLIATFLEEIISSGLRLPRVLCIGVGGGALLAFLRARFEFDILGVEMDEMVLKIARKYFGLVEGKFLRVSVGDGIQLLEDFAWQAIHCNSVSEELVNLWRTEQGKEDMKMENCHGSVVNSDVSRYAMTRDVADLWYQWGTDFCSDLNGDSVNEQLLDSRYDRVKSIDNNGDVEDTETGQCQLKFDGSDCLIHVIMIDLDSDDARNGLSAPPLEFVKRSVLLAARLALHERGILAVNVIPPSKSFYDDLIHAFKDFFSELYELDVGNGENYVLIATPSPPRFIPNETGKVILETLRQVIDGRYMDNIRKI